MTTTMTTFAYDRRMTISTAGTRKATIWKPEETRWSELVKRLSETRRGAETLAEYLRLPKTWAATWQVRWKACAANVRLRAR